MKRRVSFKAISAIEEFPSRCNKGDSMVYCNRGYHEGCEDLPGVETMAHMRSNGLNQTLSKKESLESSSKSGAAWRSQGGPT